MRSFFETAKDKAASISSKAIGVFALLVSIFCFFMMFSEMARAYRLSVEQNNVRDEKMINDNEAPNK